MAQTLDDTPMSAPSSDRISVHCQCGKKLSGPSSALGKKVKCPKCDATLLLQPAPAPATNPKKEKEKEKAAKRPAAATKQPKAAKKSAKAEPKGRSKTQDESESAPALKRMSAPAAGKKKKKKKKAKSEFDYSKLNTLIASGIFLGVLALSITLIVVLSGPSQGTAAIGNVVLPRQLPSSNPADWKNSLPAFAASLKITEGTDPQTKGPLWILNVTSLSIPHTTMISWQSMYCGDDTRFVARQIGTEGVRIGFETPGLPQQVVVVYSISPEKKKKLDQHKYQVVNFAGRITQPPRVLWLDREENITSNKPLAGITPASPATLTMVDTGGGITPIIVVTVEVVDFQAP